MSFEYSENKKRFIMCEAVKIYKSSGRSKMRKYVNDHIDWYTAIEWCKEVERIANDT